MSISIIHEKERKVKRIPVTHENELEWFLEMFTADGDGLFDIRRCDFGRSSDSKGCFDTSYERFTDDWRVALEEITALAKGGWDVYLRQTRQAKNDGERDSARTACFLAVDMDTQESHRPDQTPFATKDEALEFLGGKVEEGTVPPPTLIISTGYGIKPVWWLTPCVNTMDKDVREKVDTIQKNVARVLKADLGNAYLGQLVRPIGTVNHKRGSERPVTIETDDRCPHSLSHRYTLLDFTNFEIQDKPTTAPSMSVPEAFIESLDDLHLPPSMRDLLEKPIPAGKRSEKAFGAICAMLERGASDALVLSAIKTSESLFGHYKGSEKQLQKDIERARKKLLGLGDSFVRLVNGRTFFHKHLNLIRAKCLQKDSKGRTRFNAHAAALEFRRLLNIAYMDKSSSSRFTSGENDGVFMLWSGTHWKKYDELIVDKDLMTVFGQVAASQRMQTEIKHSLRVECRIPRSDFDLIDAEKGIRLFLSNSVLDPLGMKSEPHHPNNHNTFVIPIVYDSEAKCPEWQGFLMDVVGQYDEAGGWHSDIEAINVLQEYVGYCLQTSCKFEAMMFLIGIGANGKSIFIQTIASLLGDLAEVFSFMDFGEKFRIGNLEGKLLAYSPDETGTRDIKLDSTIKAFVSGERLISELKYQQAYGFTNYAKGMWPCNHAPAFADHGKAMERRLLTVHFNRDFSDREKEKARDRDELLQSLKSELAGILNWAIEGLQRLWTNGSFTKSIMVENAKQEMLAAHDPLREFLNERCEIVESHRERIRVIHEAYVSWCTDMGVDFKYIVKERNFARSVMSIVPRIRKSIKTSGVYYLLNLKLLPPPPSDAHRTTA